MFEDIIDPNSVYVLLLLCLKETSETLNPVIFETTTELITIGHVQSTKTFFLVKAKLPFIIEPVNLFKFEFLVMSFF